MMELYKRVETHFINWLRKNIKFVIGAVLWGMTAYFTMISLGLVNGLDGIWHGGGFFEAGNWEISLGRGLQRYFDKIRFGIVSVPLNTMLTLLLTAVAVVLMMEFLSVSNIALKILITGIFIANPVMCGSLSYSFTSVNFGLAFLFSVVAAYLSDKFEGYKWGSLFAVITGGTCIGISMACYQSYFSVTCTLMLLYFIRQILLEVNIKKIMMYGVRCIGSILAGGIIYLFITNMLLLRAGIELASYKGAENISIGVILTNLPYSVINCYKEFFRYFTEHQMYVSLPFVNIVMAISIFVTGAAILYQFLRLLKTNWVYAVIFLGCVCCMPIACNAVILIAVGNEVTLLMSMGMVVALCLSIVILPEKGKSNYILTRMYLVSMALILWFNIGAVTNNQLALKEGVRSVTTLGTSILNTLASKGYLDEGVQIALIGRPGENPLFANGSAYWNADGLAQFAHWSTESGNHRRSWYGMFEEYCGVSFPLCSEAVHKEMCQNKMVAEMPVYPYEGSVQVIDGIVVVKISEVY